MKTRTIIFRILLVLYVAAVAYICFANFKHLPQMSRITWGFETDKVIHFIMFLPYTVLTYFSIGRLPRRIWKSILLTILLIATGCLFAAATEVVQSRLIYRSGDFRDFEADLLAISISGTIVLISDITRILVRRFRRS